AALRQTHHDLQAREHQALHDPLTGLPNRALLYNCLQQAISIGRREDIPFALLLMDLDRFKEVNDTLGHQKGDLLLRQIGPRLRNVLRDSDTLARLGGDEFAAVLPHAGADEAALVAQKILNALREPVVIEGLSMEIGASIGIALYPEHGAETDLLMQRADVAMYAAKRGGGYAVYAALYDHHNVHRLAFIGELRQAIEGEELALHYQPKISLATGEVVGVEALVRWHHPQHGLIEPGQFIPIAERTGLINRLTLWVLDAALRQGRAWHEAGLPIGIAVNLSVQSLQNHQLPDQIMQLLHATGFAPQYLELEITESIMSDPARATDMLMRLSELGVRLSIDGFGTGYSSLSYLKKPPVDEIKIGQSFVIGMAANKGDAMIVRQIIDLAHAFGIKVVGEGVETREVLDLLAGLNCDFAQGYYTGGPLSAAELTYRLLQRQESIN
ncbi:MAG: EAL domain-containing protein, partial [Gammaproteobacteria bacterium]|nr:EAL domain-containing protein [Gammaproteobacteria bacterium]